MDRSAFVDGWECRTKQNRFAELGSSSLVWTPVVLPHDAVLGLDRDPDGSPATGYWPGGVFQYRRQGVVAPAADRVVVLEFEAVYRDALVMVNGTVAERRPNGYVAFPVRIDHLLEPGADNEIVVECRAHDDSRWYSGAGIHRPVWWWEGPAVHVPPGGMLVRTVEADAGGAVLDVEVTVANVGARPAGVDCVVEILDPDGTVVARQAAPVSTLAGDRLPVRRRLSVETPHRWSPADPALHSAVVTLVQPDGEVIDRARCTFGIRTLTLDPQRGLRINGEPVLLRGACLHHDNGPLGAAAIDRAEERRIERLRDAGFNAIRSAHNPASRAMLEACDRLGVLVMDEAFDAWMQSKHEDDYALRFAEWWDADLTTLTRRAVNHPSVVMISTGNEIPDGARVAGRRLGRLLAERVRAVDPGRYVTQAITGLLISPDAHAEIRRILSEPSDDELGVNTLATRLAGALQTVNHGPAVTAALAEPASYLDVVGYNYMESRMRYDAAHDPHRIVVATESYPTTMAEVWAEVVALPNVIGEFTWTGWDYLGEVGVGRTDRSDEPGPAMGAFHGPFPARSAGCADLDLIGDRRPQSYCREVVFGLASGPFAFVESPWVHDVPVVHSGPWSWADVERSWTFPGAEGRPVVIEVYADADEVEVLLDGASVGSAPVEGFRARLAADYRPGRLEVVARRNGVEIGRDVLETAGGASGVRLTVDRAEIAADPSDLAYVTVEIVDAAGRLHPGEARPVEVSVDGPAVLAAVGSGDPCTEETFTGPVVRTFGGRALAVVRPTGEGTVTVTATAAGLADGVVTFAARGAATRVG